MNESKLPVSMGGLGLRAAEDHAPAAYTSSYLSSQPLVNEILGRVDSSKESEGQEVEQGGGRGDEGSEENEAQSGSHSMSPLPQSLLTQVSKSTKTTTVSYQTLLGIVALER